jgi:hypothetical protein
MVFFRFFANPLIGEDCDDRCVLHFYDLLAKEPHLCSLFQRKEI